ncbi:response regulator transcription factor [Effusibacillus pohliae]|uniref:response regulator transcription factor n=1 Tax=Effusibacillus pohliae TaxID=232270 RepID=UPI0003815113|nr:response regulator transcription factor [Effusibacillus pohliae]
MNNGIPLTDLFQKCGRKLAEKEKLLILLWEEQAPAGKPESQWLLDFFLKSLPMLQEAKIDSMIQNFYYQWILQFLSPPDPFLCAGWLDSLEQVCLAVLSDGQQKADFSEWQCIRSLFSRWKNFILENGHWDDSANRNGGFLSPVFSWPAVQTLPWLAILAEDSGIFRVRHWNPNPLYEKQWLSLRPMVASLVAASVRELAGQITELLHGPACEKNVTLCPFVWNSQILYLCYVQTSPLHHPETIIPIVTQQLRLKEYIETKLHERNEYMSIAQFNRSLIRSRDFHELAARIATGFVTHLPFRRCAVFAYNSNNYGQGITGFQVDVRQIQSITEKVERVPAINKAVLTKQPYYTAKALNEFPRQYVEQFRLLSTVVIPLLNDSQVVATVIADCGENVYFQIDPNTLAKAKIFGSDAGKMFKHFLSLRRPPIPALPPAEQAVAAHPLTAREIEVLALMAEGLTMKEIAHHLHISEFTVRHHISSITQKLGAKNKAQAVALAVRQGVIQ